MSEGREDWPPKEPPFAFKLDGVTFSYKPGVTILHDVEVEAKMGETIALVGPTGSGKSTIASLLLRLYEAQQGSVSVLGAGSSAGNSSTLGSSGGSETIGTS